MSSSNKFLAEILLITGVCLGATSCNNFKADDLEGGEPVARVYDRFLYHEELSELVPENLSGDDSAAFVQNYINAWAKDQLMLYKAEYNLTESQKNFEDQIKEYRSDLLKFAYRQEYIRQKLDTAIGNEALNQYYEESKANFLLNENILRASYMVVRNEAPKLEEAVEWFKATDSASFSKAEEYALQYSFRFDMSPKEWVTFESFAQQLNLDKQENAVEFLKGPAIRSWQDSVNTYAIKIEEYRLKGEQAPLPYVEEVIKNVIVNRRKLQLLDKLEQNLLDDALDKKEFEVY